MGNTQTGQHNLQNFLSYDIDNIENIPKFSVVTCINYWRNNTEHAIILSRSIYNSTSGEQMYELWSKDGFFARKISDIGPFKGFDDEKKDLSNSWETRISSN
jgi:hypothetical protein